MIFILSQRKRCLLFAAARTFAAIQLHGVNFYSLRIQPNEN
jgi:hypothetical protein